MKSETVLDKTAWVDSVLVDNDIVVLNVMLKGEETKRVFKKKMGYWYSELNYRYNPVKGTGQELYEVYQKYYIYPTYIIKEFKDSNGSENITYLDLQKDEIYYFTNLNKNTFDLKLAMLGDYKKNIFFIKGTELYNKQISFSNGVSVGESVEVVYGYSGNDIFFIFDLEEYKIGKRSFLGYIEVFGNE
ncbi:hypothetical protein [Paenimyroides aestuarii]|uniref:Uncharacterized protein n=1 Tax=Paenimyroides aestuarii TaxID=2968490 RepID=A0ABY5NNX6_9FLAO|nr:hypothetical protein [Paenimyroides aestuarii]UUV20157.1 hypothetical protein NPX36_07200 [Paenimyroides aestuarii]